LELIEEQYLENAVEMGEYALDILEEIQVRHPTIGQVRGKGLMIGVEFVKDRGTKEPDEKLRERIVDNAFLRGLLLLGCGKSTIRIAPPLSVTRSEVDEALEVFEESITLGEADSASQREVNAVAA
jgi:4-aminobutyrate aminotransferase